MPWVRREIRNAPKCFLLIEEKENKTDVVAESDNSTSLYHIMRIDRPQRVVSKEEYNQIFD